MYSNIVFIVYIVYIVYIHWICFQYFQYYHRWAFYVTVISPGLSALVEFEVDVYTGIIIVKFGKHFDPILIAVNCPVINGTLLSLDQRQNYLDRRHLQSTTIHDQHNRTRPTRSYKLNSHQCPHWEISPLSFHKWRDVWLVKLEKYLQLLSARPCFNWSYQIPSTF